MPPSALRRAFLSTVLGILGTACGGGKADGSGSSTTGDMPPVPCDEETPCPDPDVCVVGLCYGGPLPMLEILTPEDEELVEWNNDADTTDVSVTIQGSGLTLVPKDMDPDSTRGSGQIAIWIDGADAVLIDEGDLAAGITVAVPVPTDAGGHRVRAEARISDGSPYGTEGSVARRFFWFDDGRERVGFKAPFENEVHPNHQIEVAVELAALHFQFAPATVDPEPGAVGIAHILLNKSFPACNDDDACLNDFVGVLSPTNEVTSHMSGPITLPKTNALSTDVAAILTKTNHDAYCGEGPDACTAVWDSVLLYRLDPNASDTGGADTTGGGGTTTGSTGETADCGGFIASDESGG